MHRCGKRPGEVQCINCLSSSPLHGFSFVRYGTDSFEILAHSSEPAFRFSVHLQCSSSLTTSRDLTTFDSPQQEIWLDGKDLPDFGKRTAREMLAAVPDLQDKGLCVGIYDEAGEPISYVPLDTLQ